MSKGLLSGDNHTHILYQFLLQIQTFLLCLSQRYYNTKYVQSALVKCRYWLCRCKTWSIYKYQGP